MSNLRSVFSSVFKSVLDTNPNPEEGIGGPPGTPVPAGPAFHALTYDPTTYEMLGVKTGTGDLTATHADTLYAPDYEGVYRAFGADEPVWAGGRVVKNAIKHSAAPFDLSTWTLSTTTATHVSGVGPNGEDVVQIDAPVLGECRIPAYADRLGTNGSSKLICSMLARSTSGTVTCNFRSAGYLSEQITLDTTWRVVSGTVTQNSANDGGFKNISIGSFQIAWIQYELADGRADQVTPSSHVPSGNIVTEEQLNGDGSFDSDANWSISGAASISGGEAHLAGTGSGNFILHTNISAVVGHVYYIKYEITSYTDGRGQVTFGGNGKGWQSAVGVYETYKPALTTESVRIYASNDASNIMSIDNVVVYDTTVGELVFANLNGNTVTNNVVTEAVGAPLPEMPYLQYYPAATNSILQSRTFETSPWDVISGGTQTQDETGIDGTPNSAWTMNSVTGSYGGRSQAVTIPADTNTHVASIYIKKQANHPDGSFGGFDLLASAGTGPRATVMIDLETGASIASSNNNGTGNFEVIDRGDWWQFLLEWINGGSGTGLAYRFSPAFFTGWGGGLTTGSIGTMIVDQAELHLNKTIAQVRGLGPIFTTSAAVSVAQPVYEFDLSNYNNEEFAWYAEDVISETQGDNANVGSNNSVVGGLNTGSINRSVIYRSTFGLRAAIRNGAIMGLYGPLAPNTPVKLGSVGSLLETSSRITVDGASVEGSLSSQGAPINFVLFGGSSTNSQYANKLRNLQRYDITSYQDGKDIIDGLMT